MRFWQTLTDEEKTAARNAAGGLYAARLRMDDNLESTLRLVSHNSEAKDRAWKLASGNYLINSPEDIAAELLKSNMEENEK